MSKYRCRYVYTLRFGTPHHQWEVVGRHGGVHFHVSDYGEEHAKQFGDRYGGGIEYHWRSPPEYMRNMAPSHDECFLLKCPCWHDGSSLYASEYLIPFWNEGQTPHDAMFRRLEILADGQFDPKSDDDE